MDGLRSRFATLPRATPLARPLFSVMLVAATLGACSDSDPAEPPLPPHAVVVFPAEQSIASIGVKASMAAEVRDINGKRLAGDSIRWSRRGTGATQVSDSGVVTTIANGVDTIVATSGSLTGLAVVRVEQVPASVTIASATPTFSVLGASTTLSATARDANGRALPATSVSWSSSNAVVLPVNQSGVVVAARPGSAMISAMIGTLTGTVSINVSLTSPVGGPVLGGVVPCVNGFAGSFPCERVELLSFLPVSGLGGGAGVDLNDIWGWTDPTSGKEYAIVMRRDGTAFVDVSDPVNPVYLGFLPITAGATANIWHDVKVYANHAFIVADAAGPHGMQVFDLTRLRAHEGVPRTFSADATYTQIRSAHNIAINEATGFAYIVGASGGGATCGGGLHMVDIRSPKSPLFAGCFADPLTGRMATGYTHDVQCVIYAGPDAAYQGREICVGSNETALSIADVTVKDAPLAIARASYPQVAYAHQGWFTEDHRYFLLNDELDESQFGVTGTRTMIWDVQELSDPVLVGEYLGPNSATDHNHYIRGTRMYASTYQFGLRVVDVSNPALPSAYGYFDTAPQLANMPGFGGSWSNYPFFASGIVVMTSRGEGFFVLRVQ